MKLTIEQVKHAILIDKLTVKEIAHLYKVTEATVWRIMKKNAQTPTAS